MELFKEFHGRLYQKYGTNQNWHFNDAIGKLNFAGKEVTMKEFKQIVVGNPKIDEEVISMPILNEFFKMVGLDPEAKTIDIDALLAGLGKKQVIMPESGVLSRATR